MKTNLEKEAKRRVAIKNFFVYALLAGVVVMLGLTLIDVLLNGKLTWSLWVDLGIVIFIVVSYLFKEQLLKDKNKQLEKELMHLKKSNPEQEPKIPAVVQDIIDTDNGDVGDGPGDGDGE